MKSSLARKISTAILVMIVLSTMSIGAFSYFIYRNDTIKQNAQAAQNITAALAAGINADEFLWALDNNEKNQYWYDTKAAFDSVLLETGAAYLYILDARYDGIDVTYYLEGGVPGDEEDTIDLCETESVEYHDDVVFAAMDEGVSGTTDAYDAGEYGILVGAASPVFDKDGAVVGVVAMDMSLDDVMNTANRFGLRILLSIAGFNVIFILISLRLMNKWLGRPLKALTVASEKIGNGDMDVEINLNQQDEIGLLAENLKVVAKSVSELISDINKMSVGQNRGDTDAFIVPEKFSGAYKDVALGINEMVKELYLEQGEFQSLMTAFGNGNFSAPIRQFPGKKARLNETAESLRGNLKDVGAEISSLANSALSGDLSVRIDASRFSGDWAKIVETLNKLLRAVEAPISESTEGLNKIASGYLDVNLTGSYEGAFAVMKDSLNSMSKEISSYISEIKTILLHVSSGDLRYNIERDYLGQFTEIKEAINNIVSSLNSLIGDISNASGQVSVGASQLSSSSQLLSKETYNQNMLAEKLSDLMERINIGAQSNEQNAKNAHDVSQSAINNTNEGSGQMQRMLNAMEGIQNASNDISNVIGSIETIAFQTNILALNAAVEAARAGEHGKGFGVVAEEVGNLARNTQKAVHETAQLIEMSIQRVNEGSAITEQTAKSFNQISSDIEKIGGLVEKIMGSSEEQAALIATASGSLTEITDSISNNSATTQETSALSEELNSQAALLLEMIKQFDLLK